MIFNLREAGTEVCEGTTEWRSRVEREVEAMRFRVPTTIHDDASDSLGNEGDNGEAGNGCPRKHFSLEISCSIGDQHYTYSMLRDDRHWLSRIEPVNGHCKTGREKRTQC